MVQFRAETLAVIRRRVMYLRFGPKFIYGTTTAQTATTFRMAAAARFPNDTLNGRVVYVVSGTGSGQSATITDSEQGTGQLTVTPAFAVTLDGTSNVEVYPEDSSPEAVNQAINMAILDASDIVNVKTVSDAPTIDATRTIVTIPASVIKVYGFQYKNTSDSDPILIKCRWHPDRDWPIGTRQNWFTVENGFIYVNFEIPTTATEVRILGYRLPAELTSDSSTSEVRSDYLIYKAAALLESEKIASPGYDPDASQARATSWLRESALIRPGLRVRWEPNTVEV